MSEPTDYFDFDASNSCRRLFARNVSLVRRPPRHETAGGSIERAARPDPAGLIVAFSAERERSLREGRQHISRQSAVAATIPMWQAAGEYRSNSTRNFCRGYAPGCRGQVSEGEIVERALRVADLRALIA